MEHDLWRQEIASHIQKDSTAIALICYRMMTAFHECLLGVPTQDKRTNVNFLLYLQEYLVGQKDGLKSQNVIVEN